ncbi:hypothetical protein GCM10008024_06730 [Allgaiera indica]|uniref:Uncharacterized membrane protein YhhN n=1 Tax=Allgaiera indica TaxID=765699 RepID=A0AAN4ZYB2_9RHOB|nr:lysoplasmalogenase [Allgaiera indica]GHD99421.1 hypothetical protein GCM10008024_06730 [Allgaiera indica]SDW26265.1 Uncharacterized membrane protein YhhN [Allgaiera indica]
MAGMAFSLGFGLAVVYLLRWITRPVSWQRSIFKTMATALLAAAALPLGAPPLIALGLALGAVGDLALSRPGQRSFLIGMAAFAAGHLAYAWLFLRMGTNDPLIVPSLVVLVLAGSTEFWLAPRTGALKWPVRGYVLVITAMMLAVLTLPGRALTVMLGAALFVLSDLLLAIELFCLDRPSPWLSRSVWLCYWGGQALILLGTAAALGPGAPL